MSVFHLFLVAVIQGITEFLPVSSSGHLILLPKLTGLQDQGLTLDVAVHMGTLAAVVLFFYKDVWLALAGVPRLLAGKTDTPGSRLAFLLIIATIPVIIIGFFMQVTGAEEILRSTKVIGWTMLVFGLVLYWADQHEPSEKTASDWSLSDALTMGLAQAIALIPGTSRSGITITAARKLGYRRTDAAKISMLMSIPTILASGTLLGLKVVKSADTGIMQDVAIAATFSFLAALVALTLMMRLLKSVSFTPYVIYRVILGLILLWIAYT